jgi:hypothetical protein
LWETRDEKLRFGVSLQRELKRLMLPALEFMLVRLTDCCGASSTAPRVTDISFRLCPTPDNLARCILQTDEKLKRAGPALRQNATSASSCMFTSVLLVVTVFWRAGRNRNSQGACQAGPPACRCLLFRGLPRLRTTAFASATVRGSGGRTSAPFERRTLSAEGRRLFAILGESKIERGTGNAEALGRLRQVAAARPDLSKYGGPLGRFEIVFRG